MSRIHCKGSICVFILIVFTPLTIFVWVGTKRDQMVLTQISADKVKTQKNSGPLSNSVSNLQQPSVHEAAHRFSKNYSSSVKEKVVSKLQPPEQKVISILYMEGWIENEELYNGKFSLYLDYYSRNVCGFSCVAAHVGESRVSMADVVVFQPSSLKLDPPKKHSHQYWILHSFLELQPHELSNYQSRGYYQLIDYILIRPFQTVTPLFFLHKINAWPSDKIDSENQKIKTFNFHPNLNVAQIILSCDSLSNKAGEETLEGSIGYEIQKSSGKIDVQVISFCYGKDPSMHIPADMSFVILNQNSCFNSLLDQLLFILKNNFNAIPIIPLLPHPDDYRELSLLAPPNSYLLFKDFDNVESLVTYLKRTIENKELFASYHSWKRLYTMNTVGGKCYVIVCMNNMFFVQLR